MYEDGRMIARQYKIGPAWQVFDVQAITEASGVESLP